MSEDKFCPYCSPCRHGQRIAAAEAWRGMIDPFVRRIMDELGCGKACGGLDADQNDPNSTTQVVLQGIRDGQQRAVDAALEHVAGLFDRVGKRDEAGFLRSWCGTNPLAEAQARIAELERQLEEARRLNADLIARHEATAAMKKEQDHD